MIEDTIAAISTALGVGAISIIRVSGKDAISIVNKIFDKDLTLAKNHTIHYGHIIYENEIIDEVLVSVMLAPKTFTREDVIEINSHGGIATTNKILEILLTTGCRLAEPGEFTKRAFLNGRIDLQQADGIMNLIESKTETARKMSINQLTGNVSKKIKDLRDEIISIVSNIEVNIDYPEYDDIEVLTNDVISPKINQSIQNVNKILKEAENGKIIEQGISIGIIGKPNVGKSSLLNTLLEENKAIVTDIEGTTRDIVEGQFKLNGIICNIIDTAGIRKTDNIIEQIGVEKSKEIIKKADLILFVLNNSEPISTEEKEILETLKSKNKIIIINKTDLPKKIELIPNAIEISIKNNKGIELIKNKIIELYNLEAIETSDVSYLSNARSISLLNQALNKLKEANKNIELNFPIDIVEIDLKEAWNLLGEIIGETYTDEMIDEMFSRFCLGK